MKFRKKPVVIEAIQFKSNNLSEMILTWGAEFERVVVEQVADSYLVIYTLEGNHVANMGDWIIKGIKGEFYPCKPDIFEMTYERVE
jgi:hypothetical protein